MISPSSDRAVNIFVGIFREWNQEYLAEPECSKILSNAICLFEVPFKIAAWIVVLHGLSYDTVVSPLELGSLQPEHDAHLRGSRLVMRTMSGRTIMVRE